MKRIVLLRHGRTEANDRRLYCGAADLNALHSAKFVRITANGVIENHPHDLTIAKPAPNYNK